MIQFKIISYYAVATELAIQILDSVFFHFGNDQIFKMNYCSNCGNDKLRYAIPEGDHLLRFSCDNCNTIHYTNPNMVVGCLLSFKGKILLARRGIEPRKGYWNLPCGFLENNETVEEGALREVKEETGLAVDLGPLHTVYSLTKSNQVYLIFLAEAKSSDFILNEESVEIQFFERNEIPWGEIAFSSNTFALEKFINEEGVGSKVFSGNHPW